MPDKAAHSPTPAETPLVTSWSQQGFPPAVCERLAAIEMELDMIHRGWRRKQRFDNVNYDRKARIKWLLRWHGLLAHFDAEGNPDPRADWVVIIARDLKNPEQCYAHAVPPDGARNDDTTKEPRRVM